MTRWGLTPEEDAELRRLHFLLRFGSAAVRLGRRYTELRQRDRRTEVRDPDDARRGGDRGHTAGHTGRPARPAR